MAKRTKKPHYYQPPNLERTVSVHSNGPLRQWRDDDIHVKGASMRRDKAGESVAPTKQQQADPGPGLGRTQAGGAAAKDRPAARPDADNPNLIALGARNKLHRHDQDSPSDTSLTRRVATSAASSPDKHEEPEKPKKLLHLKPYGQLTPLSDQDKDADVIIMAPAPAPLTAPNGQPGPHPSFIEVAKPYIFQQKIDQFLSAIGMAEAKEDSIRLQGVQLIDNVRKSLQL